MAAIAASFGSCSQEPIVTIDPVVEEYTRNFIKEFGIPAQGHDFAMATSAGLRVKTDKGAHVTVTAEIDGKNYLFADLDVPAGTHALPVTIPSSVTTLKVSTGLQTFEVGVNDIVDIDADVPSSRGWDVDASDPIIITENEDGDPILVFSPEDFLKEYLQTHPVGEESTNKWYAGKDMGDGSINPNPGDEFQIYYGETGLGATQITEDPKTGKKIYSSLEYLIFPVWWHENRNGYKNYKLKLVDYNKANNGNVVPFCDITNTITPFPSLGYSFEDMAPDKVLDNKDSFHYDDGSFKQAYDPNTARTVVSKGLKVTMTADKKDKAALRLDLWCGPAESQSYSSSVPYWNRKVWQDKFYDETLSELMFATVSTMRYTLPEQNFNVLNYPVSSDAGYSFSGFSKYPFLIGFTSSPEDYADTESIRDYTDLILLVLPTRGIELIYNINEPPEPFVWTMAVEDLGGTDDWDFNDVVFHFTDVIQNLNTVNRNNAVTYSSGPMAAEAVRTISVWPVASGGTMPAYITFTGTVSDLSSIPLPAWGDMMFSEANDNVYYALDKSTTGTFVVGTEVHRWLGASHYTQFVNVGGNRNGASGEVVQFVIPYDSNLKKYEDDKGNDKYFDLAYGSFNNVPLYGFALLVDKENTLQINAFNDIDHGMVLMENLKMGEGTYMIGAPNEKGSIVPQMLLIADGEGEWEWPTERTKISDAYPGFKDWIKYPDNDSWISTKVEGKVTKK